MDDNTTTRVARRAFVVITEEMCTGCGLCAKTCPGDAISGQIKSPFVIDVERCTKCGTCMAKCRVGAITMNTSHAKTAARSSAGNSRAKPTWLGNEPVIAHGDIAETFDTEVLVVGNGTAGLFAICSAVENSARAMLIEKNALSAGVREDLGAVGSSLQKREGLEVDKAEIVNALARYGSYYVDQRLIRLWADESAEAIDWYTDLITSKGAEMWCKPDAGTPASKYQGFPTGHSPYIPDGVEQPAIILEKYATGLGAQFLYETALMKLVKEDGRVIGAIATNPNGDYIRINASKGVILCTGGYAGNAKMLRALQPGLSEMFARSVAAAGATGDGIKAALWAGAVMDSVHTSMLFDRVALLPRGTDRSDSPASIFHMGSQPFLKVNLNGERFANESCPYDFVLHASSLQPGNCYVMIWDSSYPDDIGHFDTLGCSRFLPYKNGAPPNIAWEAVLDNNAALEEQGFLQVANTIEELAERLHLPVSALKATVNRYNELAAKGLDEDWGKEAHRLSSIDEPPYFGICLTGFLLCTLDGIRINTDMQALAADRNAIRGLYVCGNDSGGYYAHTYPNLSTGNAAGRSITFGRRAGRIAATS